MIADVASPTVEGVPGEPLTTPGIVEDRPPALQWWDHQRRWLEDHSRLRVCCKARQIGMSTALAIEALHAAVYGETTVIVSASQRQASELLRKGTHSLPLVTVAAEGVVRVDKQSAEAIELSTGGRVIPLPASAATVQGYTGHVVIDEAAWIPDVDSLWMAIVPTISTRREYRLSIVSTPGPRAGMFHRLWNNGDEAWSRHRVSIYDARAGGAPHDIYSLRAAVADEATWRAAYECQFVDEAHALLPYDLLLARVDDTLSYHLSAKTLFEPGDFYAGYDVGRKRDLSVLIVLERIKKEFRWRGGGGASRGALRRAVRAAHQRAEGAGSAAAGDRPERPRDAARRGAGAEARLAGRADHHDRAGQGVAGLAHPGRLPVRRCRHSRPPAPDRRPALDPADGDAVR